MFFYFKFYRKPIISKNYFRSFINSNVTHLSLIIIKYYSPYSEGCRKVSYHFFYVTLTTYFAFQIIDFLFSAWNIAACITSIFSSWDWQIEELLSKESSSTIYTNIGRMAQCINIFRLINYSMLYNVIKIL